MKMNKMRGRNVKSRVGNYRVTNQMMDYKGNVGIAELECYIDCSNVDDMGAVYRHINRKWLQCVAGEDELRGMDLMFTFEADNSILLGSGFCNLCVRFELDGLSNKLDDSIWEVLVKCLIGTLENSKFTVLDK